MKARQYYLESNPQVSYSTFNYRIKKGWSFEEASQPSLNKPRDNEIDELKERYDKNNKYDVPWKVFRNRRSMSKLSNNPKKKEELIYPYTKYIVDEGGRECTVCGTYKPWKYFTTLRAKRTFCDDCKKFKK